MNDDDKTTYQLTPEEARVIEKMRGEKALRELQTRRALHLLQTASSFAEWVVYNEEEPTIDVFYDDYGYAGQSYGMSRNSFFFALLHLINNAEEAAKSQ